MRAEFLDHHGRARSPIHVIDPRIKITLVLVFIVAAATTPPGRFIDFAGLAVILAAGLALTRIPVGHLLGKIAKLAPFVFLMALGLPFVRGGEPFASWRVLGIEMTLTREGVRLFGSVLCKAGLALGAMVLLANTTPFPSLVRALERFRLPAVFTGSLAVMYRYLFVFFREKDRLLTARESRLAFPSWRLRWTSLAGVVGVLFIRSLDRGERVYQAMRARGFEGAPVTALELRTRPYDWAVLGLGLYLIGMAKYVGLRIAG